MNTDKSRMIAQYISRYGNAIRLERADGSAVQTTAIVQRAWTRMKLHFEEQAGKAGRYSPLYYYYIGPSSLNILQEPADTILRCGDEAFYFTQKEAVCVGNTVQYYRGLLKPYKEEPDVLSI